MKVRVRGSPLSSYARPGLAYTRAELAGPRKSSSPDYHENANERALSWRAAVEIVQAVAFALVIAVALNLFVVQVTEVHQRSMETTLEQNDRVLVSKLAYRIGLPQRGDIIVFDEPIDPAFGANGIPLVKRVVALTGETIDLRDGAVFVNGSRVEIAEASGPTVPNLPTVAYPYTVPDGHVFVLGDNRTLSSDSRTFGPVPLRNIVGKVILRFWPLTRLMFFEW